MAEYIDRALALREVKRWENGITVNIKAELKALPPADVIERSKIDKVIDEIIEKSFISDIYNDRTDDEIIKLDDVLEILKRNIGE